MNNEIYHPNRCQCEICKQQRQKIAFIGHEALNIAANHFEKSDFQTITKRKVCIILREMARNAEITFNTFHDSEIGRSNDK